MARTITYPNSSDGVTTIESRPKTYSFKSVGVLSTDRTFKQKVNESPIGLKTPLRLGEKNDGIFAMHFSLGDQIQDNLRNLLLTNWGERVGFYDFGANLKPLTIELTSDEFDSEVMTRIKSATSKWMSYIELKDFQKTIVGRVQESNVTEIRLLITYDVPKISLNSKALELSLFFAG